ncbi:hypothetical protein MYCTH_2087011 [Thermothelomyces thermophilus ATCC 42464]|uniref:HAUS augmin-like complex subunit 3 N-terminal domain-containing protein n=1 Tax=Thermothelomyces thermophilus (strain ATCC 42464 / BCRC 31852 / DSM 1799) TaxID=573729 RepID=G2Q764_THET4|nr:uncharacterized protein MYCTH_2087011 [Thermothelomyces thermophilus ATCC 42464]AEO55642.1 hypothetical protein MYCTH_2087011 [Thermothelomyces thermophilus ATCC 42464]
MDAESLITVLRAYDPSFDASAVRRALSDPASIDLFRWATLHLTPDTLLTANELSQYAALEQSGLADKLAKSSDLAATCLLSDQEIKDAIEELHRSTQAITRHTEALRQQQEALGRLVDSGRESLKERVTIEAERARAWQSERSDLALHTDELLQSLGSRVSKLEQRSTGASATIQQTAENLFSSDDRLLSSLQKLGLELEAENDEEQRDVALLRETCARLIKFTVEIIRTRLDRLYLEALEPPTKSAPTKVSTDEVSALQEEVESLYAEILPVAQMSTEQQFLEPALRSLAAKNGQTLARSAQAISYSYQLAANAVLDLAKAELQTQPSAIRASPTQQQHSIKQQGTVSPVHARPSRRSRYSTGAPDTGDDSPLEEILRTLAISLPQEKEGLPDLCAQVDELSLALAGRREKLQDAAFHAQQNFEEAATKYVTDGKLAIQLVHDSILAESPFGGVRLVDAEIERSIAVLSQELRKVDEKLSDVCAGVAKLKKAKSAKRDEFISRWGS